MRCPVSVYLLGLALSGAGCADAWTDPNALPLQFVPEELFSKQVVPADLDRDGRDETLMYGQLNDPGVASVLIESPTRLRVEQVNAEGRALRPAALELDGDDPLEIVFPYARGDTLHALLLDHEGRIFQELVLATGRPREMDGGTVAWNPTTPWFAAEDVDGDGRPELVTLLTTGFSPVGRGVYVHDPRTGEEVGRQVVGATVIPVQPAYGTSVAGTVWDVDDDGVSDWAFYGWPTDNGGEAGGLDDQHSVVGVFSFAPTVRLLWAEELGGIQTHARVHAADFDGDGRRELLASTLYNEARSGRLEMRDPATGAVRASREMTYQRVRVLDATGPSRPRILLHVTDTEVVELDAALRTVGAESVPAGSLDLYGAPDLDGDGRDEIFVAGPETTVWVGADFRPRAVLPVQQIPVGLQRVVGAPQRVGFRDGTSFEVYRVEPNRFYLLYRHGPVLGALSVLLLAVGVGAGFVRLRRRAGALEARLAARDVEGPFDAAAWRLTARRVVHDLRNPLTSVLLNAENLRRAALVERDPEAAEHYARRIEERVERLRGVTRNFLKFVDLEPPALREVAPADFLTSVADELREDLPPDVELVVRTNGAGAVPDVRLDPEQMASVVENLVANAVNALPEGGRVTLAAHAARGLQAGSDPAPRDWAVLEVRDAGTGIDPAVRDRLFEPGVTGTTGGAGFGLAVVRKTVSDHGGYVEVESEPGAGTVVSVFLPAATAD